MAGPAKLSQGRWHLLREGASSRVYMDIQIQRRSQVNESLGGRRRRTGAANYFTRAHCLRRAGRPVARVCEILQHSRIHFRHLLEYNRKSGARRVTMPTKRPCQVGLCFVFG